MGIEPLIKLTTILLSKNGIILTQCFIIYNWCFKRDRKGKTVPGINIWIYSTLALVQKTLFFLNSLKTKL